MIEGVVAIPLPGYVEKRGPGASRSVAPLREFLVGPENALVPVALDALLCDGPCPYRPVVLAGPAGCGKSHLALGLFALWKSAHRGRKATYTTAHDFTRELNDAIEAQVTEDFRARHRRVDLLVVEDIEQLGPKPSAQRELLYSLDAVLAAGGRVVLTSAVAPEHLSGFLPALQSRLIGGLTVPLALPAAATRLALVRALAAQRGFLLDDAAAAVLAEGLDAPATELLGALIQLDAAARMDGRRIDAPAVRDHLARRAKSPGPSLREIALATARHFRLKLSDLRSPSRRRAIVAARGVAMYLARSLTGQSFEQIGVYFDGRDHTTVSHGCLKTKELLETDPDIRDAVRQLRRQLGVAGGKAAGVPASAGKGKSEGR